MRRELSDHQRRCVDSILGVMKEYLDIRFAMSVRANPRFRDVWPLLQNLQLQQLRNTLERDKMWGPARFVIGELLCSHDRPRIRDIYNPSHQSSIQTEVVEKKEEGKHKTADLLDIHDFRTLFAAIDPGISQISTVMQIYLWWDLPDAADLAKFNIMLHRVAEIERGWNDEWARYYMGLMGRKEEQGLPTLAEAVQFEFVEIKFALDCFVTRRDGEPGYRLMMDQKRTAAAEENVDRLIATIAREQVLLRAIEAGQPLDEGVRQQFARALNVSAESLTPEMEINYLRGAVAEQKNRLREGMESTGAGEFYLIKHAQAESITRRFEEALAARPAVQLPAGLSPQLILGT